MAKNNKPASAYAKPHKMSGKGLSMNDIGFPPVMPKRDEKWTPLNGGVSLSNNDKPERGVVKIRGTGAATKGLMARGGMA